jgi:hypothetical protein
MTKQSNEAQTRYAHLVLALRAGARRQAPTPQAPSPGVRFFLAGAQVGAPPRYRRVFFHGSNFMSK